MAEKTETLRPCICGAVEGDRSHVLVQYIGDEIIIHGNRYDGVGVVLLVNNHDFDTRDLKQGTHPFYVVCLPCGLTTAKYQTAEEAIDAWNNKFVHIEDKIDNERAI